MAITISGQNNNDKILASDGVLDSISGFNVVGVMTAAQFDVTGKTTTNHISIGNNIHLGNAGIITTTTLLGNVTGNINHTSNLLLQINGSEKFRVGNGGQFGIAGANYGTAGQVFTSGGSGSAPTWSTINSDKITEGNTEAEVVDTGSDGHFKVTTEGSERLRITSDGKIGIGIASPTFAAGGGVHLKGGNEFTSYRVTAHTNTGVDFAQDAAGNGYVYNRDNADLTLGTNNAQRVRINNNGAIGLGGANYGSSGQVLTSQGSGSAVAWTTISTDLVNDTSPQLGADLDCNQKGILLQDRNSGNQGAVKWGDNGEMWMFHAGSDNTNRIYSSGKEWAIWSGASNDHACLKVTASDTDPAIELYYNNSKKLETTNTGTKVTGNLQFASAGQGIDFSASTHASGKQSELLDDYERGSWTPQFFNARTGGTQLTNPSNTQANYVKVGRIVYLHLGVHGLTKNWAGSNTQIFIRGLPYRSYFQHNGHCVRVGYFGGGSLGNDDMNVYANLRQYDTYMELQKSGGAQGRYEALYWSDIHWEGYGNLTCEMVYETDQGV